VVVGGAVALAVGLFAAAIAFAADDGGPRSADPDSSTTIEAGDDPATTTPGASDSTAVVDTTTSTVTATTVPATTAVPTTVAATVAPSADGVGGVGASSGATAVTPAATPAPPPPDPIVPTVTGQSLDQAAANLRAAGFNDVPYVYDCYGSNNVNAVVSQSPAGGGRAPAATPIRLQLQANDCAFVPGVIGLDLNSAASRLQAAGFNDIPYVYECLGSPAIGAVVTQSPSGGQVPTATPIVLQLQAADC
jgi:serine/threonine-protein kinase